MIQAATTAQSSSSILSPSKETMNDTTDESKPSPKEAAVVVKTDESPFSLAVKKEYIVSERPACLGPVPPRLLATAAATDDGARHKPKKRPRDVRDAAPKLCRFRVRGQDCPHADACKFSHDMIAYLETRPPPLDVPCPGGTTCRFGVECRLRHETRDEPSSSPSPTRNVISHSVLMQLRKKTYPFVCQRHAKGGGGFDENTKHLFDTAARDAQRKTMDFRNKIYVAPLTTVGNLPFRRIVKHYGADITCGEMALATCLLEGKQSEWALVKRHACEDVFGIQLAAGYPDQFTRACEVLEQHIDMDFVDLNLGCPIDLVCDKGAGSALMLRERRLQQSLMGICNTLSVPVTIKMRTGWDEAKPIAKELVQKIQSWNIPGIAAIFIHGRSRLQRYSKTANWDYIAQVACSQSEEYPKIPIIGNGDIFSYTDYEEKVAREGVNTTAMLARGALIKPWLPTEIKERRHWDISASERMDMLKDFVRFGLEHWGSDQQGVNTTRRFLLEWLSFLYRYVPVGLLERIPQVLNHRPPNYMVGRNDLETLFLSPLASDWIIISERLLGPVPEGFKFAPKHKANAYAK